MGKFVIFAFRGDPMCFIHVLLNALDLSQKGHEARIVMEGEAVKLIRELEESANPLYGKVKEAGLFASVCRACSAKMGVLDYNETCGIPLGDDMNGHPSMALYLEQGYQVITL